MNLDISKLAGKKVLVVGDAMLDTYHVGKVKRISPEAPVPVVQITQTYSVLGGAANVARNLAGLGCCSIVIGLIGNDANGELMKQLFVDLHIENELLKVDHPTITKTRVIGNNQQIVRIDFEQEKLSLLQNQEDLLIGLIEKNISSCDSIVISDYGKGVCTYDVCQKIVNIGKSLGKPVVVDPKGNDWNKYAGATIVTPNMKELSDIVGFEVKNEDSEIHKQASCILSRYNLENLLITRSEKGMTLSNQLNHYDVKTEAREVYDVSGAGDTVVATLAASLAASFPLFESVCLSNKAAGIVVGKMGTSPIYYNELLKDIVSTYYRNKIVDKERLSEILFTLRTKSQKIVFTNGCFDIIHKGHVAYLQESKKCGDVLIVGLNSDASVRRLKGESRPINTEMDRATVLEAMECIDYIIVFGEDTPHNLIKEIQPDVLVKGGDYEIENVVGREFAKELVLVDFQQGYSSSHLINKLYS